MVHGAAGWDEPTPVGPFTLFDVRPGAVAMSVRCAADYGLPACTAADLAGGDATHNAHAAAAIESGAARRLLEALPQLRAAGTPTRAGAFPAEPSA